MNRRDFFKRTAAAAVAAPVIAKAAPNRGGAESFLASGGGFTSSARGLHPVEPHETAIAKADKARETRGETV
jgi:hypothetical protein